MTVGDNIKRFRLEKGMTQAQLADHLNVSEKTISSWEVNRTEPNMGNIESLSKALGCRKSDLIGEPTALSSQEYNLIKKYRFLDEYGVKNVHNVLNNEFDRCVAQDRKKEGNIS